MNGKVIAGIIVLSLGIVIIAVLCGLGGYAKGAVEDGVKERLEYELPKGYETNPNFEQCYKATTAEFNEEYYVWNLTNLPAVLVGEKPNYNLTGPYCYSEWYCEFDHKIDESAGVLTYKRYSEGFKLINCAGQTTPSDDTVPITNANPGYLAALGQAGGDSAVAGFFVPSALSTIITQLQGAAPLVQRSQFANMFGLLTSELVALYTHTAFATDLTTSNVDAPTFFGSTYTTADGTLGFTNFASTRLGQSITLSTTSQEIILQSYKNVTLQLGIINWTANQTASLYQVTEAQAGALQVYANYLRGASPLTGRAANQWANGPTTYVPTWAGWEIGVPDSTGISPADVMTQLWNPLGPCSLTNATTFAATWGSANANASTLNCPGSSLTDAQKERIFAFIPAFTLSAGKERLRQYFNLASWDDFGYAQWGRLLTGSSLNPALSPEIAAYTGYPASERYTDADARALLNGTNGLMQLANLQRFSALTTSLNRGNLTVANTIFELWPQFSNSLPKLRFFGGYMNDIVIGRAVLGSAQVQSLARLFVTRTVNQWLFTAVDPLIALLSPSASNVGIVKNTTYTKEAPEIRNIRIYTGKNDLYNSLMPIDEGERLDMWRGDVFITGFNGSQFLPNHYLDKPKQWEKDPLVLYHKDIIRPIPFQNKGKDNWDGINVRYLTLSDRALASDTIAPENYPYYATYSGAINQTSKSPHIPVFLTTPNFLSADEIFTENISFTDSIHAPTYNPDEKFSRHRLALFILAEPKLGSAVWGNLPIQANFRVSPGSVFFTTIRDFYAPIYWKAIGDKATPEDLQTIKDDLYANQRAWKILIGVGVGVGVSLVIVGIALIAIFRSKQYEQSK